MVLSQDRRAIAIFSQRQEAESALAELQTAGISVAQISVVTKELDSNHQIDGFATNDFFWYHAPPPGRATCAAITGSMVGAICGCLFGLGLIVVPGIGPIVALGTVEATLAATLAGAGVGVAGGSIIENLVDLRSDIDQARPNSDRVSADEYLVIVTGTEDEVSCAKSILSSRKPQAG